MLTVFLFLAILALICAVMSMAGYPPHLAVAVILLALIELIRALPIGK